MRGQWRSRRCHLPCMRLSRAFRRANQPFTSHITAMDQQTQAAAAKDNPLLEVWGAPFRVPALGRLKPDHFPPAFAHAFESHAAEVAAISGNAAAPSFENTIAA